MNSMLKEREFRREEVDRPVDNRYGADFDVRRSDYGYYDDETRYDAYQRSFDDRGYGDAEYNGYYAHEEYGRGDYRRDGYPQYDEYEAPAQDAYRDYGAQSYGDYGRADYRLGGYNASGATTFEHVEYETKKTKRRTLNAKSKMLIAIYFVLVAVIASLIIANVVAFGGGSVEAQAATEAVYNEEALNMAVTADGSVVEMNEVRYLENYGYEKNTNWFDSFCDWVANISK